MGMRWKEFRPSDGIMKAEGHSHVITLTVVRGLGSVLQYNYTGQNAELNRPSKRRPPALTRMIWKEEEIYIPTPAAGAGVVKGHHRLEIKDYAIGAQQGVITTLNMLGGGGAPGGALKKRLKEDPESNCPVGDIVALTTSMICQAGSPLVQVPAPSDNVEGITTDPRGREAFEAALYKYVVDRGGSTTPVDSYDITRQNVGWRTCWALWQMQDLNVKFQDWSPTFQSHTAQWVIRRPVEYFEALNQYFEQATNFLANIPVIVSAKI